jgi:hypothetical protein
LALLGINLFTLVFYGSKLVYRIGVQDTRLGRVCDDVAEIRPRVTALENNYNLLSGKFAAGHD